MCLQTHSCFRVYTRIYHSSKQLVLKWCAVKIRWVWTEPICLYNCVLPQSKWSYGVFIKIELPQCKLTIFHRHCDMSTKQLPSATRNRCPLQAAAELLTKTIRQSYPQKAGSLPTRGNSDNSKTVFIPYLEQPEERRELPRVGLHGRAGNGDISRWGGLVSWWDKQDFCPEIFLENQILSWWFPLCFSFQNFPLKEMKQETPSLVSHFFTRSEDESEKINVFEYRKICRGRV